MNSMNILQWYLWLCAGLTARIDYVGFSISFPFSLVGLIWSIILLSETPHKLVPQGCVLVAVIITVLNFALL